MGIEAKEKALIEDFSFFENWMEKYEHIIELGKELKPINEAFKTDDYLIKGCQSQVWLNAFLKEGKVYYEADSDAIITKGIIALLMNVLSGEKPSEIVNTELSFIEEIGLTSHLSPTRANGLLAMLKQMKTYALGFQIKEKSN